jgi:hypothetical protein
MECPTELFRLLGRFFGLKYDFKTANDPGDKRLRPGLRRKSMPGEVYYCVN